MKTPEERAAQKREYNGRNADKMSAAKKRYATANAEHLRAKRREWRAKNRDKLAADKLAYYLANKAREDARVREWRAINRHRLGGYWEKWYYSDLDHSRNKAIESGHRRRSRLNGVGVTRAEWVGIKEQFGHRCAYCACQPKRLEQDHLDPLVRGGRHEPANIVPACRSCNARKHARTLLQWLAA